MQILHLPCIAHVPTTSTSTGNKKAYCVFAICQNSVNCDGAMEVSDHAPHRTTETWRVSPSVEMLPTPHPHPPSSSSRLLYRRGRKPRRDLRITLYFGEKLLASRLIPTLEDRSSIVHDYSSTYLYARTLHIHAGRFIQSCYLTKLSNASDYHVILITISHYPPHFI
jgi:hypothetical protein